MIRNVLNAGAVGYLLKSELANKLKAALNTVCRGRPYLSRQVEEGLANQFRPALESVHPNPMAKLSSRELEVIHLLSEGQSSKEIAYNLAISVRTVETHRANSMRKLGVHSVTELLHCVYKDKFFTS
jgi:DNA-binding NarL/FixJ family response regulator